MNTKQILGWSSALCLGASALQAQETSEVEALKRQLKQATESFQKAIDEQRRVIDELNRKIETIEKAHPAAAAPTNATAAASTDALAAKPWSMTEPLRAKKGSTYLDIGLVGNIAVGGSTADDIEGGTQLGGHDPNQRGFTLQGLEMSLAGAVDPYFRGNANLTFAIDSGGESLLEVEEAWLETMTLPGNLSLRAGQILTDFGRHNPTHLHAWNFVDTPSSAAGCSARTDCGIPARGWRGSRRHRSTRNSHSACRTARAKRLRAFAAPDTVTAGKRRKKDCRLVSAIQTTTGA
ncbi:MAG: hypothetical protein IPK15_11795 [Verrucomicrobia bacterium]|nr:hypothetical protein [Verrucomicrobiota bacterium]